MKPVDMDDDDLDLEATASFSAVLRPAAPPPAVAEGIGPLEITFHGFKTAAEAGDVRAAYRVGICLLEGRGCVQDLPAALAWLLRAADQRDLDAQVMVASCYLRGEGGPVNVPAAVQWLEIAARHGSAEAQFSLGDLRARGAGVKADKAAAAALWQDAAEQGYARAQLNLALAYVRGDGVPVDMPLALSWLTRAADSGYAKAEYNLGQLYLKGAPEWRNAEAARTTCGAPPTAALRRRSWPMGDCSRTPTLRTRWTGCGKPPRRNSGRRLSRWRVSSSRVAAAR